MYKNKGQMNMLLHAVFPHSFFSFICESVIIRSVASVLNFVLKKNESSSKDAFSHSSNINKWTIFSGNDMRFCISIFQTEMLSK